jgi:hypothetical protein
MEKLKKLEDNINSVVANIKINETNVAEVEKEL